MSIVKYIFSTVIALSLLMGLFANQVSADGTETEEKCEETTIKRTITETGAYGQTTQREVEEKVCKIEVLRTGMDLPSVMALSSLMTVGAASYVLKRKLG